MKTKFSEWMSRQLRSVTRRVWLGVVLCGALKLAAAVWIEAHWETVTGTGWIPVWVDGHYETEHVPGFWETQPVAGYWEDRWVEGHTENVWVDEYWCDESCYSRKTGRGFFRFWSEEVGGVRGKREEESGSSVRTESAERF